MIRRTAEPGRALGSRPPAGEKLQKVLARAGLGSRREVEAWIAAGRVSVNGTRAGIGTRVVAADQIRVDGRRVDAPPRALRTRVIRYHKPAGEISTRHDPERRPTVFERLPRLARGRWVAVGRLDVATCGLLLFTNDGELANRLMHPSRGVEREYAVRVRGAVAPEALARLVAGVELDDGPARFERVVPGGGEGANRWYHVVVREGRHHEVRRLWESQGVEVSRLVRVRYGPIGLPRHLRTGRWDELEAGEVAALRAAAGLARPPSLTSAPRRPRRRRARARG